jgi:uncharacterized membrane protein
VLDRPAPPAPSRWRSPYLWLAILVVGFFAISFYAGAVSYADLQTQNATDAGIITQAVASTSLGHNPPFFESYDCMVKARCSFLLVHPGLVLVGAVPFFALFPSTLTLFALRSALVALSAVPLFFLTRRATGSPGKGLLAAGLFLVWAPGFLGDAFSLHLETLLPLELFTLVAIWQTGRYRIGLAVAAIAFLTIEIAPVFTFLVGVFFLVPYVDRFARSTWRRWRSGTPAPGGLRATLARGSQLARAAWTNREIRFCLVLMGASVAAYVALLSFMNVWGAGVLGVASPVVPSGASGVFYDNSTPASASLATILHSSQTVLTAEYWLILYATLAFLPLLSPRSLVLSVPWIGWTFLSDSSRFTTLGHQYSMIAAGPLFIGLAFGLTRVPLPRWPWGRTTPSTPEPPALVGTARGWRSTRRRAVPVALGIVLVAVVAGNVLLAPVNPVLGDLGVDPGAPFQAGYFDHSLAWDPGFTALESLIGTIPHSAMLTAPPALFPLVATYPHAYVLLNPSMYRTQNLPFPASSNPQFVLMTADAYGAAGVEFRQNLSEPALYGITGYVGATDAGPIVLYETGYSGNATRFGAAIPLEDANLTPGNGLQAGPIGQPATSPPPGAIEVIESVPGTTRGGMVATTASEFLAPGAYTVTLLVRAVPLNASVDGSVLVLHVNGAGIGPLLINATYPLSQLDGPGWTALAWCFDLASPLPEFAVQATLRTPQVALSVASVAIVPST